MFPQDAEAARRAVTHFALSEPSTYGLELPPDLGHPSSLLRHNPAPPPSVTDQCRRLVEVFPSLTHIHVALYPELGELITTSIYEVQDRGLTLVFNRATSQFSLYIGLIFCPDLVLQTDLAAHSSSVQNSNVIWRCQSPFYQSLRELSAGGGRFLTSLCLSGLKSKDSGAALVKAAGFELNQLPSSLRVFTGPVATLVELDHDKPQWSCLESLVGIEFAGRIHGATVERGWHTLGDIVSRSPNLQKISLKQTNFSPSGWHPLVSLLHSVSDRFQGTSAINRIEIHVDSDPRTTHVFESAFDSLRRLDLGGQFPSLQYVSFNWPGAWQSEKPGLSPLILVVKKIASVLTTTSGAQGAFEGQDTGGNLWELMRKG